MFVDLFNRFAEWTGIVIVSDRLPGPDGDDATVLDVPGYVQTQTYTCGFVAGLMVLHAFKPNSSIDLFYRRVAPHEDRGASTEKIATALRKSNIGVGKRESLTFDAIADAIEAGYPIVTTVSTGDPEVNHWVVIYGVGRKPKRIFLAANGLPFLSHKKYPWRTFKDKWCPSGFGLVCWGK